MQVIVDRINQTKIIGTVDCNELDSQTLQKLKATDDDFVQFVGIVFVELFPGDELSLSISRGYLTKGNKKVALEDDDIDEDDVLDQAVSITGMDYWLNEIDEGRGNLCL